MAMHDVAGVQIDLPDVVWNAVVLLVGQGAPPTAIIGKLAKSFPDQTPALKDIYAKSDPFAVAALGIEGNTVDSLWNRAFVGNSEVAATETGQFRLPNGNVGAIGDDGKMQDLGPPTKGGGDWIDKIISGVVEAGLPIMLAIAAPEILAALGPEAPAAAGWVSAEGGAGYAGGLAADATAASAAAAAAPAAPAEGALPPAQYASATGLTDVPIGEAANVLPAAPSSALPAAASAVPAATQTMAQSVGATLTDLGNGLVNLTKTGIGSWIVPAAQVVTAISVLQGGGSNIQKAAAIVALSQGAGSLAQKVGGTLTGPPTVTTPPAGAIPPAGQPAGQPGPWSGPVDEFGQPIKPGTINDAVKGGPPIMLANGSTYQLQDNGNQVVTDSSGSKSYYKTDGTPAANVPQADLTRLGLTASGDGKTYTTPDGTTFTVDDNGNVSDANGKPINNPDGTPLNTSDLSNVPTTGGDPTLPPPTTQPPPGGGGTPPPGGTNIFGNIGDGAMQAALLAAIAADATTKRQNIVETKPADWISQGSQNLVAASGALTPQLYNLSPNEIAAQNLAASSAGGTQPLIDQSAALTTKGAAPLTEADIASNMNPYLDLVAGRVSEAGEQQRAAAIRRASMAGADLPSTTPGVTNQADITSGVVGRNTLDALGQVYAGGYNTALGAAQNTAQRELSGGSNLGALANTSQANTTSQISDLGKTGALPRQAAISGLQAAGGALTAAKGAAPSTVTTTLPPPSLVGQLVAGAGALNAFNKGQQLVPTVPA